MTTYESSIFVGTEDMKPGEIKAFVHIWNSAASISNPTTRVWGNRQNLTSTLLTGSDSAASNVQTGKFLTIPASAWGKTYIYEWTADVEGQTLKKWLRIRVSSLPRGA